MGYKSGVVRPLTMSSLDTLPTLATQEIGRGICGVSMGNARFAYVRMWTPAHFLAAAHFEEAACSTWIQNRHVDGTS